MGDSRARTDAEHLREFLATRDVACPKCGYNLRGLSGNVCPECETAISLVIGVQRPVYGIRWGLVVAALIGESAASCHYVGTALMHMYWAGAMYGRFFAGERLYEAVHYTDLAVRFVFMILGFVRAIDVYKSRKSSDVNRAKGRAFRLLCVFSVVNCAIYGAYLVS